MLQKEKSQSPTYITTTSTSGNAYTYHFGDCAGNFYFISPHQDAPTSPHIPVQQPPPQKHGQLAVPNRPHSTSIIKQVPLPKRPPIYVDFPTTRVVISGLPRLHVMEESNEVDQLLWTLKKVAESESFDPSRHVNIRSYPEEDKWVVNVPNEDCAEAIHAWVLRHRFMGCDLRACYEQVIEVKDFN
ncbi:hypothetical protein B566_EDAN017731 [Ephemera danica]|nr:hypothetical protein B566_EDAN017731 [Ephemera danica]